jgi:hypothetical protein
MDPLNLFLRFLADANGPLNNNRPTVDSREMSEIYLKPFLAFPISYSWYFSYIFLDGKETQTRKLNVFLPKIKK